MNRIAVTVAGAAVVLAAYAPVWQQARSFNSCISTWKLGTPANAKPAAKQMFFVWGHSVCSGGSISDEAWAAWLDNASKTK